MSCPSCSIQTKLQTSRVSSLTRVTLPHFRSLLCRAENPRDRPGQFVPFAGLQRQLAPAFGGQTVELGPAIVLRGAFFERNPLALDQPVQRWIKRTLFDLQDVVGIEFDGLGDGVAVRRPQQQRAENQQVQGSLQQFYALFFFFSSHSR